MTSADQHIERAFFAGWLEALSLTIEDGELDNLIEHCRSHVAEIVSDYVGRLEDE